MDTSSVQRALNTIWSLLFAARVRTLTEEECKELLRLCGLVRAGVRGMDGFNERIGEFCDYAERDDLRSADPEEIDRWLEQVDAMRLMLS
jgi:hypothetical protein